MIYLSRSVLQAPYQKKFVVAQKQYDTDLKKFLESGGTVEKGVRALRK